MGMEKWNIRIFMRPGEQKLTLTWAVRHKHSIFYGWPARFPDLGQKGLREGPKEGPKQDPKLDPK